VCCLPGAWVCCLPGDCSGVIGGRAPWCQDLLMARGLESETRQAGGGEVQPHPGLGSANCLQNICRNILIKFECLIVIKEIIKQFLHDVETAKDLVARCKYVRQQLLGGIVAHGSKDGRKATINQMDDNAPLKTPANNAGRSSQSSLPMTLCQMMLHQQCSINNALSMMLVKKRGT
jgi:hypothetical protein